MNRFLLALILLVFAACSSKKDKFNVGDDAVIGDNDQVSISLAYPASEFFVDVNELFDYTPTLITRGIYDSGFEYSVFPPLPSSISFDITNGRIWGRFTQVANPGIIYFVQAKKDNYVGSTSLILNFVPPIQVPSYNPTELKFSIGQNTSYSPAENPGAVSYRVFPSLPSGISINNRSGAISGTPSGVDSEVSNVNYTVYAVNNNGLEKSVPLIIRRVGILATSFSDGSAIGISGGSDIDLSQFYIGGRGGLVYQIISGLGVMHGSFFTPSDTDGNVTVRATDIGGLGSSADITFHIEKPTISCEQTLVEAGQRAKVRLNINGSYFTTVTLDFATRDGSDPIFGAVSGTNYLTSNGSTFIVPGNRYTEIEIETNDVPAELNHRSFMLDVTNVVGTKNSNITCEVLIAP